MAYIGLASYDRVSIAVLQGARRAASRRCAARVACSRCWATCPAVSHTRARPTSPPRAATTRRRSPSAARCIAHQRPVRPRRRPRDQRARGHAAATWRCSTPSRRTSSTRRSRATSAWSTARRATASTSPPTWALLDEYRARLAAWQARLDEVCRKRGVAYLPISDDAAAGGPRVRRAAPAPGRGVPRTRRGTAAMSLLAPLGLIGLLSRCPSSWRSTCSGCAAPERHGEQHVPVAAPRPRRGGERALAAPAPLAAAAPASCCWRCCFACGRGAAGHRSVRRAWPTTSCWSSTPRRRCPPRTSSPTA